jgi:DNA-directed RNA polymerase subunit RPC12/RpoP
MRRARKLPTLDDLSHYCLQCGKQVTPPEMIFLSSESMKCPHCGDPYKQWVKKPPQPSR